ncbi:hypothetical protein C8R43DRAFT_880650 [Mycena crocata]|nr:hypothetical protein C8R43DRAFT_880650 [Mycena crocata]
MLIQIVFCRGSQNADTRVQDLPFQTWVEFRDQYLDEMLRLEGRGDAAVYSTCGGCGTANPAFRCENQACFGAEMFCQTCVVARHQVLPTHWLQEWKGTHFERVGLAQLGLIFQLGHTTGAACMTIRLAKKKFTVIDVTGIHTVNVQFCHCDGRIKHWQQLMRVAWWPATVRDPSTCATFAVIRLFQNMNCLGKLSGYHFLRSLELLTNADGLNPPPNRRRAFMYIVRQHRMMEMMKRAGRGHCNSGVGGTAQGELALSCRACPQPGKNIPDGWNKIDWSKMPQDLSYKYFLFLAQDCNFRLINRNISTEARDPVIDDGLGYFVNRESYKEFLRAHVDEEEISTCSGFRAMFLANAKRVKGLRTTGVGGVTCARHNMWRPNGIGDLQKGERFCNMDFILFSAILNSIILFLILSYDIACQFSKNFWGRMKDLPEAMHIDEKKVNVWFKVPNFHILGHKWPCHSPFSFHWMWGAGVTDGEDVEQNWEFTNGAAGSTKMMGLGARAAFLEGLFAFHNWMRTVSYRNVFSRRLARDLKEGKKHKDAFDAFTALVEGEKPELVAAWRKWVKDWEGKQHSDAAGSPYELPKHERTMKDIRLELEKKELTETGRGVKVERKHTSSGFIMMGLEIEQSQRILMIDMKAVADPSTLQELDFVKRKTAMLKRIARFRKLQATYMPNIEKYLTVGQRELYEDKTREPQMVKLFMPSELLDEFRWEVCERGLDKIEEALREGELQETLEELRTALRIRTATNRFRHRDTTGQRALTRGQGLLRQVSIRILKAKLRYRYARNALMRLRNHGGWEKTYQVLQEEDIRGINERAANEQEEVERERLRELGGIVEGGIAAAGVVIAGQTKHKISWIWLSSEIKDGDTALIDSLRVEWCKAYSLAHRWHEDIVLVDEEMRRTIEYGAWSACEWEVRATARTAGLTAALEEGLRAYAMEHVAREHETCSRLSVKWSGLRAKAKSYLEELTEEDDTVVILDLDDDNATDTDEDSDVEGDEEVNGEGEDEIDTDDEDD